MIKSLTLLVIILLVNTNYSQEIYNGSITPYEPKPIKASTYEIPISEKYKNIQWYYTESNNFELVSTNSSIKIDEVIQYAEKIKDWTNKRWGFKNIKFKKSCMIICFPSQQMFEDCLKTEYLEPKETESTNLDESKRPIYAIWITEDNLKSTLKEQIAKICLLDQNNNMPLYMRLGISYLNNDIKKIRQEISDLKETLNYNDLNISTEQYNAMDSKNKKSIVINSAIYCLMLKKEYQGDINNNNKFNNFGLYRNQLLKDLASNKVPLLYFTWFNK